MSLHDSWVRVARGRARDPRTGLLSIVAWAVLDQVWAIAADEGEVEDEDVLCPAGVLDPGAVLLELPRGPDATLAAVEAALAELRASGCLTPSGPVVRVHALARYNRERFRKRDWARATRHSSSVVATATLRCAPAADVDATETLRSVHVPEDRSRSRSRNRNRTEQQQPTANPTPTLPETGKGLVPPEVLQLAEAHALAVLAWKPNALPGCRSPASLRAYDAMMRIDGRPLVDALALVEWLFRGAYQPRDAFDWRVNVLSGSALRKHWDRLESERGRANGHKRTTSVDPLRRAVASIMERHGISPEDMRP